MTRAIPVAQDEIDAFFCGSFVNVKLSGHEREGIVTPEDGFHYLALGWLPTRTARVGTLEKPRDLLSWLQAVS